MKRDKNLKAQMSVYFKDKTTSNFQTYDPSYSRMNACTIKTTNTVEVTK